MRTYRRGGPVLAYAIYALTFSSNCANKAEDAPVPDNRQLSFVEPTRPDVGLEPGSRQRLNVLYLSSDGRPLPGEIIDFFLSGDPKGSTLSADTALTDAQGIATVELHAGSAESTFSLRASAKLASSATLYIEVGDAGFGVIAVQSVYHGAHYPSPIVLADYLLYNTIGCGARSPYYPADADRMFTAVPLGENVRVGSLRLGFSRSLLALGFDANGQLSASGCVDLTSDLVKNGSTIELRIVLEDLPLLIEGTYELSSHVRLDRNAAPLVRALKPWRELVHCPLAPAQLLLDCMIDVADGRSPSDCDLLPASTQGIAALLESRRSLTDSDGCRSAQTDQGEESLDQALTGALMQPGPWPLLTALRQVPAQAEALLSELHITTSLVLYHPQERLSARRRLLNASHRLSEVGLGEPLIPEAVFRVAEIASPLPLAPAVPASVEGNLLTLGPHKLSIRFGILARRALIDAVLTPAEIPSEPIAMVKSLIDRFQAPGTVTGCPALSAILCRQIGQSDTCMLAACEASITALAQHLEAGFDSLVPGSSDLELEGSALLISDTGNGVTERLGGQRHTDAEWSTASLWLGNSSAALPALSATFSGQRMKSSP